MLSVVRYFIENRVVTLVLTTVLIGMGIQSFQSMSRLEDPEFTIKDALIVTSYPGATAEEVEQEVTDAIEQAVQKLGQVDSVSSRSETGLSTVTVTIQDRFDKETLPQVWDELRRKVEEAKAALPPGAGVPRVIDDYGDVYGVFFVVTGDEFTYAELKEVTDTLKRELLLVEDVAKIDVLGEATEAILIELDPVRLAQLGVPAGQILQLLQDKNIIRDAGRVRVGEEYLVLDPTGATDSVEDMRRLRLSIGKKQFFLGEIAKIRRGYKDPMSTIVRYNGQRGIAIGISTASGGNVVRMGAALQERMEELITEIPLGIEFGVVSVQSEAVTQAVGNFLMSLVQAVAIVILTLLLFMGLRSGLLIGFVLVVTILGSFIFLKPMEVALERISLGALIISLGMLVDNAIVVVDGMLVRIQKGQDSKKAALDVVSKTAIPLLGATAIAVLAFAAIGTSEDSAGEFCRSLYQVILVSLSLSWVTAMTITPLLGILILKPAAPGGSDGENDPYDTAFYRFYRKILEGCLRFRWITMGVVLMLFLASLWGFGSIKNAFFPPSTRPQFQVDLWLPQGTHIEVTSSLAKEVERKLIEEEGVTGVTTFVGRGGLRFLLTYSSERPNSAYAQFLVDVEDSRTIDELVRKIDETYSQGFPRAQIFGYKFELGPGSKGKIEPRFLGEDPKILRQLGEEAVAILEKDADVKAITQKWRERVKVLRPQILEEQASLLGITREDIGAVFQQGFQGRTVGVFRDGDLLLPLIVQDPAPGNENVGNLYNLNIWSPVARRNVSLSQLVVSVETEFRDDIIIREDRRRLYSVFADPINGTASEVLERIAPEFAELEIPAGYTFEWGGEYKSSKEANESLSKSLPLFLGIMILVTILLFNSLRQTLVIWLCVPLILIGVATGLLLFDQPFNFMAILGFLSLVGMLIKNAIVLVDEINAQESTGQTAKEAILNSGVSRLRPVAMAASTTALGMLPLFADAFFVAMAITIIFGLVIGSVLTMLVLPVIYSIIFGVTVKSE